MKIVSDDNIPGVADYLGDGNTLLIKPGRSITRADLVDADILLVRSKTVVNQALLHDTPVCFVGSAVAGLDHLDTQYLNSRNIKWIAAEGCNAVAVAEYVICVIAALQKKGLLFSEKILRAAVIGVGRVGKLVVSKLEALNFEVIQCDPFYDLTPLDEIADVDLICLHTPLTYDGKFPTYRLINEKFLTRQKEGAILLNAGRGEVINSSDLKKYGKQLRWCLDVFENEPEIDLEVVTLAEIVTPHIAGHTIQAKWRGFERIYDALFREKIISGTKKPILYPKKKLSLSHDPVDWRDVMLAIYDPLPTSQEMKQALLSGEKTFDELRKAFPARSEFEFVSA